VVPPQVLLVGQDVTQVLAVSKAVEQIWVAVQRAWLVAVHWTHAAPAPSAPGPQAGLVAEHSDVSPAVQTAHVCVLRLHTPPLAPAAPASVPPLQSLSCRHGTQALVVVSQTPAACPSTLGAPVQFVLVVHATHVWVVVLHTAGRPSVPQASLVPDVAVHSTQTFEVLQIGVAAPPVLVVPTQSALSPLMH
jgi:hypothetical protein